MQLHGISLFLNWKKDIKILKPWKAVIRTRIHPSIMLKLFKSLILTTI